MGRNIHNYIFNSVYSPETQICGVFCYNESVMSIVGTGTLPQGPPCCFYCS